jgi:hypothetical protein
MTSSYRSPARSEPIAAPPPATGTTAAPPLREQAAELRGKAARGARNLAEGAKAEARSRLDEGRRSAAATLSSVATSLMQSGSQLRSDREMLAGEYIEKAAHGLDRAAQYVQNADLGALAGDVEAFARRRPAVFIGSAFALGLLAGRLLRSARPSQENGPAQPDTQGFPSGTMPESSGYAPSAPPVYSDQMPDVP